MHVWVLTPCIFNLFWHPGLWRGKRPLKIFDEGFESHLNEFLDLTSGQEDRFGKIFLGRVRKWVGRLESLQGFLWRTRFFCKKLLPRSRFQCRRRSTFCRRGDVLLTGAAPILPRPAPVWMGGGPIAAIARCRTLWNTGDLCIVVTQGAAMLANLSHDIPMNARSTLITALINEGDFKRRCVEGGLQGG